MRALIVTCPRCGANLPVTQPGPTVVCAYCGTEARIQQRSRVWQVPQAPPPGPQPVARQRVSKLVYLWPVVMVVAVGAGLLAARRFQGLAEEQTRRAAGVAKDGMSWAGSAPVLADVDGDGVQDVIGLGRYLFDGDQVELAAFAGVDGRRLWRTPRLGTFSQWAQARVAARGAVVTVAGADGTLIGFDRATGAERWRLALGEKVELMCAGPGADELVVATADQRWRLIANGVEQPTKALRALDAHGSKPDDTLARFRAATVEAPGDLCLPIDNNTWSRPAGLLALDNWATLPEVPGMYVEQLVRRPGGPVVATGYKSPGTAVPMLAGLDGDRVLWSVEVPSVDRLAAGVEDKAIGLGADTAYVAYHRGSDTPLRIVAFALADGARRWEVEVPTGRLLERAEALLPIGDVVVIATSMAVVALAQADGRERYRIGSRAP